MDFESSFLKRTHSCHIPKRRNLFKNLTFRKKFIFSLVIVSAKHPNHKKYLQCDNDMYFEKFRQIHSNIWYVMHPFCILAVVWDVFMTFFYILDLYNVPFWKRQIHTLYTFAQYIIFMNIVRQFFTGYVDVEAMVIVLDIKQIALRYLRGWFALDLFGCLDCSGTISRVCSLAGYDLDQDTRYHLGFLDIGDIWKLRLFFRSLRLSADFFIQKESMKRLLLLVLYNVIAVHWLTCLTVFVPLCIHGIELNGTDSWLTGRRDAQHKKAVEMTNGALYLKACTRTLQQLLGLGVGGTAPTSSEDMYMVMVVVVLGRLLFFYVIEEALSINNWVRSATIKFHVMKHLARGCMRKRQVPQIIRDKVELFYDSELRTTINQLGPMGMLSSSLRDELLKYDTMRVVKGSSVLRSIKITTLERVARFLTPEVYLPNDALVRLGGPIDCVFFLEYGTVAVYERNGVEACHLTDGAFLGGLEFASGHDRRTISIVAIEVCEVYRLEGDEFSRLLRLEPKLRDSLLSVAEERLGRRIERVGQAAGIGM